MSELTQMLRWNTNFVRGLAQTVLARARNIRSSLPSYAGEAKTKTTVVKSTRKKSVQSKVKKTKVRRPGKKAKGANA